MNTEQKLLNKLAELKAAIAETELAIEKGAEKPREVVAQQYVITADLHEVTGASPSFTEAGSTVSQKDLERVIRERGEAQVLGCIIREENEITGYVANWSDYSQLKWCLFLDARTSKWDYSSCTCIYRAEIEYCNEETAIKLVELLNNGAGIQGVRSGS